MKKVLITGATSGIGRELAIQYVAQGARVSLVGRRTERLKELKSELGHSVFYRTLNVTDYGKAEIAYNELISEMGGLDIMILNAGISRDKLLPPWRSDKQTISVNVMAFAHGMHFAFDHFSKQGYGQIVGMSSVSAHMASGRAAAYTASKSFISNYMTGFRQKAKRVDADITITDLKPGYVWSEITQNNPNMFWVSSTEKAARQMIRAIDKKKNHAYVTTRWRFVVWLAKLTPQFIWDRL